MQILFEKIMTVIYHSFSPNNITGNQVRAPHSCIRHSPSVSDCRVLAESGAEGRDLLGTPLQVDDTPDLLRRVVVELECLE